MKKIWNWIISLFIKGYSKPLIQVDEIVKFANLIDKNKDGFVSLKEIKEYFI